MAAAAADCLAWVVYLAVLAAAVVAARLVVAEAEAAEPLAVWAFTCPPAFILLRCRSRYSSRGVAPRSCWREAAAWGQQAGLGVHWAACWAACLGEERGLQAALEALWEAWWGEAGVTAARAWRA